MEVKTDKGFAAIASIRAGDKVWARNEQSGLMNYQSVLRTINSTDPDTAYLVVADQNGKQQTIVSDSKHPYFAQYGTDPTPPQPSPGKPYHGNIANAYWVNAANLEAGHKLIDDSGNWQTVVSVTVKKEPLNSYNLEVDNDHTYFIRGLQGERGIWVHNKDCWNQLPANATMDKVGGQEVYRFTDRNRTVMVVKNDKWTPGGKEAKYYEVNIVDGKAVIANANKPDVIRLPNGATKHPDTGQFISDPTRRSSQTTNNDKYKWMEQYQNPDAKPGFIPDSTKEYFNNNYFTQMQRCQAPQNGTKLEYKVYQQQIDPNARPFMQDGDMRTNLQLMQTGRAAYVLKNGKYEQLQLHHANKMDGVRYLN